MVLLLGGVSLSARAFFCIRSSRRVTVSPARAGRPSSSSTIRRVATSANSLSCGFFRAIDCAPEFADEIRDVAVSIS